MANQAQRDTMAKVSWPVYGVTATHLDTVLYVNGVRLIVYPNGKLDVLAVENDDHARETEASIRERFGHLILGHVAPYRREALAAA